MPFSRQVREDVLVKSARFCCLCQNFKGTAIQVHHIVPESKGGSNDAENAIPLCYECHMAAGYRNQEHALGTTYQTGELKRLRDNFFRKMEVKEDSEETKRAVDEMRAKLDAFGQRLDNAEESTYPRALVAVSAAHGVSPDDLKAILVAYAGQQATRQFTDLDTANAMLAAGQFEAAEESAIGVAERFSESTVDALLVAGTAALQLGHYTDALPHFARAARLTDKECDPIAWLKAHRALAIGLAVNNRPADAVNMYVDVVKTRMAKLPEDDSNLFDDNYNLGCLALNCGAYEPARRAFGHSFNIARKAFPRTDIRLGLPLQQMAMLYQEEGDLEKAEEFARKFLGLLQENKMLDNKNALLGFYTLAKILRLRRKFQASQKLYEKCLALCRAHFPPDSEMTTMCLNDTGLLFLGRDNDLARAFIADAIRIAEPHAVDRPLSLSDYYANLGRALGNLGQFAGR